VVLPTTEIIDFLIVVEKFFFDPLIFPCFIAGEMW
jgi:hypothetical protein